MLTQKPKKAMARIAGLWWLQAPKGTEVYGPTRYEEVMQARMTCDPGLFQSFGEKIWRSWPANTNKTT